MSSTSVPQPNPHGPEDRGAALISMFSVWSIGAMGIMTARLWSRLMQRHLGVDDHCMLLATITLLAFFVLIVIMAARGGFQHIYYVDKGAISYILELYYFSQVLCVIADAFGKISIAFLLLRVMGSTQKWKKYLLYIVIALTAIITILFSFLAFFQCTDPRALWNKASFPNAKCWKPMVVARWTLFVSAWMTFVDFFLALFPIFIILNLRMGWKRKLAVCVLLGLGVMTGILCALRTQQMYALANESDGLWPSYPIFALDGGHKFLLIALGSVPAIRPLFDKLITMAVSSKVYLNLRGLVSKYNLSRLNRDQVEPKKTTTVSSAEYEPKQCSKGSEGSQDRRGSKASKYFKNKARHPLDIPPSLLQSNALETTTTITTGVWAGNEDSWLQTQSEGSFDRPGKNEAVTARTFDIV